jgi:hypothetical protein
MSKNRGVGKIQKIILNFHRQSQPKSKKSNLLYLPNGDSDDLGFYISGCTIVENGGVGPIKGLK